MRSPFIFHPSYDEDGKLRLRSSNGDDILKVLDLVLVGYQGRLDDETFAVKTLAWDYCPEVPLENRLQHTRHLVATLLLCNPED